jgi:phosphopantothenoylcysteine synthetase/decarboxylase
VNLHDWIDELSDVLDLEDVEVDEGLLADLTKVAATNVERMAAPVTAYLLGFAAGAQDAAPDAVEQLAARAQELAEGWDRPADAPDPDDIDDPIPDDRTVDHTGEAYDDDRAEELVDEEV